MLLKNLIKTSSNLNKINILDLALDSRKVKKGSLFFAVEGSKTTGEKFIKEALNKGAKAVVCSLKAKINNKNFPIIKVKDVQKTLGNVCRTFFNKKPKNIIAVTGTNGKSSVADFYYQLLFLNKISVASIGTLGIKRKKNIKKATLTSPDIISLHKELQKLKKNNIENVIIEASSHGLKQGRLDGIDFKAGIFTNFSQDHLDYHKNMNDYFKSKMILFSNLLSKKNYLITDENIKEFKKLKRISIKRNLNLVTINKIKNINLSTNKNLVGKFQIRNLSMSVLAAKISGLKIENIKRSIKDIKNVNGRMELCRVLKNKSKIFIDYAHTPDALKTALISLRAHFNEDVTLIFGCGGDRDVRKRSIMAKIAKNYCNKIYITDDNPRNENPKKIRKILMNNLKGSNVREIGSRTSAIQHAMRNAEPYETILIAGKGHENFQIYKKNIINISDKSIIKSIKIKKLKFNKQDVIFNHNSKILKKILKTNKSYKFKGISINSKEVKKDNLFVAIKGPRKDGHDFVKNALNAGASYCVVSQKVKGVNIKKLIKYDNAKIFLDRFSLAKRDKTEAKILAITGSAGKTTVKTILGKILSFYDNTCYSPKSFNNHYGVPLSLSNLEKNHKFGVFEVGMSHPGEINNLTKLIKPDLALITNIAEAHIENFGNLKDIAKAKGEIINNICKNGTIVLNKDDTFYNYFKTLAKKKNLQIISFSKLNKADVCILDKKVIKNKQVLKIQVINEVITLEQNKINIYNILSILAILKYLGLKLNKIKNKLNLFNNLEGRGKTYNVKRYNTCFNLVDESYNANPLSVKNAIKNLSNLKINGHKKYLLLGDMLELGNKSNFYHKNISKLINKTDIDKVFVYGDKVLNTFKYTKKNKQGNILQHQNDFDLVFSNIIKKGDYLMIKGSNSTGLNILTSKIIKGFTNVI